MMTYLHAFLTLALAGGGWSALRPSRFTLWVGPRCGHLNAHTSERYCSLKVRDVSLELCVHVAITFNN